MTWSKTIRAGLFLLTICLSAVNLVQAGQDKRPNVIVIITDDQNDYGFYDVFPGAKTPSLNDFKKTAVTFKHAYTAAPVCGPSRAAFFSGLYPHTTGSYLNASDPWRQGILPNTETLPELFKRSGYKTFGMGKLYHAQLAEGREAKNFDNKVYHGGFGPFPHVEDRITRKGERAQTKGGAKFWGVTEWTGPDEDFPDTKNATASIKFLQEKHDKPFLMIYGLWRPHTPFTAPKRFFDMFDPKKITPPPGYLEGDLSDVPPKGHELSRIWGERWQNSGKNEPENWRRILHGYLATTAFADWNTGRVIKALDESEYADNTIVVFWSDNGFHLGEKDHYEKATVWEAAARIPMAIRLPKQKNKGKVVKQPVLNLDIFPTLVELCSLEETKHKPEGMSLVPLLKKPSKKWDRPAITEYGVDVFSARSERYRYIRYPDGLEELYDHKVDPFEFHNLANDPKMDKVKEEHKKWIPKKWAPSLGGRNG